MTKYRFFLTDIFPLLNIRKWHLPRANNKYEMCKMPAVSSIRQRTTTGHASIYFPLHDRYSSSGTSATTFTIPVCLIFDATLFSRPYGSTITQSV